MAHEDLATVAARIPESVGKMILEPLNHGFASAEREALKQGVAAHAMIGMLLNHMASICAMVEPAGVREELVKSLVSSFVDMVQKHLVARITTQGGVILPPGTQIPRTEVD